MTNDSTASTPRAANSGATPPHPWPPHEVFCIHSYAGELGPPCGWRGRRIEITRIDAMGARRCPRCGRTTLMDIAPPADGKTR